MTYKIYSAEGECLRVCDAKSFDEIRFDILVGGDVEEVSPGGGGPVERENYEEGIYVHRTNLYDQDGLLCGWVDKVDKTPDTPEKWSRRKKLC